MTYPTSPAESDAIGSRAGDMTPISSASNSVPWAIARSGSRVEKLPSTTRTNATTPRYWSYEESKTRARAGASGSPAGGGIRSTIASSTLRDADAGLRRDAQHALGLLAEQLAELLRGAVGIGLREVDLVRGRDDLEPAVDGEVRVGERLRLDPLRGVDDEQRALAGLERARHLVREVDVPGRVDEVELVAASSARARPAP